MVSQTMRGSLQQLPLIKENRGQWGYASTFRLGRLEKDPVFPFFLLCFPLSRLLRYHATKREVMLVFYNRYNPMEYSRESSGQKMLFQEIFYSGFIAKNRTRELFFLSIFIYFFLLSIPLRTRLLLFLFLLRQQRNIRI